MNTRSLCYLSFGIWLLALVMCSCGGASGGGAKSSVGPSAADPKAVVRAGVPQIVLQVGHTAMITEANFSPDGRRIVTASSDGTVKVWDAENGRQLSSLAGHTNVVSSASYSRDGRRIVSVSNEAAKVWDASSGKLLSTLTGTGSIASANFNPDGSRVVTASWTGKAQVWDVLSGKLLSTLAGHTKGLDNASYSPDGRRIVSAGQDDVVNLWDATNGQRLGRLEGRRAAFSPDGSRIVTEGKKTKVWDTANGNLLATLTEQVNSARFSPDGRRVVTASWDKTAKVWDAVSGKLLLSLAGHTESVGSASYSPDGSRIVTTASDSKARVWDAASGKLLSTATWEAPGHASTTFSPDGRRILTATGGHEHPGAQVWDAATGKLVISLEGRPHDVWNANYSPDGGHVVTTTNGKTAKVWDVVSGKLLSTLEHADDVKNATYSPDGSRIVTASRDRTAKVWDATTGKLVITLAEKDHVSRARYSPDGRRIVTQSHDETTKCWDAKTGQLLSTLKGHAGDLYSVSFSADGRRVVTGGYDKTAKVWEVETGQLLSTLKGHTDAVFGATFNPDASRVVTYSGDKTTKVWDAASGKLLHDLDLYAHNASYSPDGRRILTGAIQGVVKVWDATSLKLLHSLEGHTDSVWLARYSPDGRHIVTASDDKTAKVWDAVTGRLLLSAEADSTSDVHFSSGGMTLFSTHGGGHRVTRIRKQGDGSLSARQLDFHRSENEDGSVSQLAVADNGLFAGDEEVFDKVVYRIGDDMGEQVTADQLFEYFHRASLVSDFWSDRPLDLSPEAAAGVGVPAKVEMGKLAARLRDKKTKLVLDVSNRGGGAGETRIYVNGARVGASSTLSATAGSIQSGALGSKGLVLDNADDSAAAKTDVDHRPEGPDVIWGPGRHEAELELAPGRNAITVETYNLLGRIRSERVSQEVLVDVPDAEPPRLHVLLVDIGDYASDAQLAPGQRPMRLSFTDEDALAIKDALMRKGRRVFSEVLPYRVSDAQASTEGVRARFQEVANAARPQDAFVVYVSGHGFVGACGNTKGYHVALTGASRAKPCADALSVQELTALAQQVKAQQKLMLLDTCQSGGAVQEDVLQQLQGEVQDRNMRSARAAGVAVVSASAASESSYEVPAWGHGIFTVAVLKGLDGRAAFNGVGRIGVSNLVKYVTRQLPVLSEAYTPGALQTPTYGMRGSDFTLAETSRGDAPLLALNDKATSELDRGLAVLSGPAKLVDQHLQAKRDALLGCTAGKGLDIEVTWSPDGAAQFSPNGLASAETLSCLQRSLGTFALEKVDGPGHFTARVAGR